MPEQKLHRVQATEVTYELHSLGWKSFQNLCVTITSDIWGQVVQSFFDSNDGGRDGAFHGSWNPQKGESFHGSFTVQCKFTAKADKTLQLSDLKDEIAKAHRLASRGLANNYILFTNAHLTGVTEEKLRKCFESIPGIKHFAAYGCEKISQLIRESSRLRMLVPRVYGLGDLSQILDERAYAQARAVIESLREDLSKVVVTNAYRKAAMALDEYGFVLLIGEPAAGKTTIASMLAMTALDRWNASILKLDNPAEVVTHWNPEEPSQFFWLDDAFGVTQYEAFLVRGWNHILTQIKTMLRKGAKIVMTSRDYIYNRARKELKESAFPLLQGSQVVIDVHDLSMDEKRQILYNHIKLGKQPRTFKTRVKPHLDAVAAHARFVPETARRLADPLFTEGLALNAYHLEQFVEKRERFLQEVIQGLDKHSKAALALIYMRNDRLESPISLQRSEEQVLNLLGSDLGGSVAALEALNGSLVIHSYTDSIWRFKHPTISDAYAAILIQNPELLGIFVQGSTPSKLIEWVTCGDVGVEQAVIIPRALYPLILVRLRELAASKTYKSQMLSDWSAKSVLQRFLARRCSKEFLTLYLEENPYLLDQVSEPGLYLYAVSEVDLAVRLHEFGLLPEDKRKKFVSTVSNYAVEGEDLYALDSVGIQSIFKNNEFNELLESVRIKLLPRLADVRVGWELNWDSNEPPDEHMQQLLESFETLKKHFGDDPYAMKIVERETWLANKWIAEHTSEMQDMKPRTLGPLEIHKESQSNRSIFDDVDA